MIFHASSISPGRSRALEQCANSRPSEIEDCTLPWTLPSSSFDYIHLRWLVGSIPDWNALFAEAYAACRPGGWVESIEPSCIVESDHVKMPETAALSQWGRMCVEAGKKMGRTFTVVGEGLQRKGMEAAGFTDIQEFDYKVSPRLSKQNASLKLANITRPHP